MRVVRYKNYGCTFSGLDEESDWRNKFYWAFFELNNGRIICRQKTENWFNSKCEEDYSYTYTRMELKNGKVIDYEFGDANTDNQEQMSSEFFDWFESLPPYHHVKNNKHPSDDEISCIETFFSKRS